MTLLCIHSEWIMDCVLDDIEVSLLKALLLVEEFGAHLSQRVDIYALLVRDDGDQVMTLAILVHDNVFLYVSKGFILQGLVVFIIHW